MTTASPPSRLQVAIGLLAVYLIWGSTYLGIRFALDGFPPLLMAGIRFLCAGSAVYLSLRLRGDPPPTALQWRNAAIMGALLLGIGNGMVSVAQQWVSSGLAAIAVASMPLWAALFGAMYGRRYLRLEWMGVLVGFIGVLFLNFGAELRAQSWAALALLLSPAGWAFGSVWSRGRDLPAPFMSTAAQMLCGGLLMTTIGLLAGERIDAMPPTGAILALAYLAVFGSIIGFGAYIWLLHHVRPALATSYAYVNPPIAVLLGALLAGERVGLVTIVAMAVILCGVVLITRGSASPQARQRQRASRPVDPARLS
ncbi:drug/metabolite exporter YedA [Pseudofulvimonas gallinarii]|jgi:drug/metabolite transporter (DMT)-like permease|uniref:Drug/metabolite transporter (DMT)-like permease n=1 Tax=Pseudofulvimonas gallinarii TaxID=634155 RepID=A0A4S3KV94_9GAMM|nr:drug/metabolite exporter YedA [Pseudofulvimonas gallinarii]TCS98003.1 drug/metabolite transporter (DMT)-like permease [Pseudofulvimonas gallinarii]THD13153.1 drug/metabolite exporter YedA [Pseudofulvimonas gallinarii]